MAWETSTYGKSRKNHAERGGQTRSSSGREWEAPAGLTVGGREMGLSILIARIISVVYLSAALGAIFSANHYRRLPDDLFSNAGLTYVTGFTAVVMGFLIVHYHNTWAKTWPVLITMIGWLALLKGVAIIVVPQVVHRVSATMLADWGVTVFPYVAICLGLLFGYFGFGPRHTINN
jgi:hypothetical protein